MKSIKNVITLLVAIYFIFINQITASASENVQEKYCEVGSIISLNNPNTIYNASNKAIVELIEKQPSVFAIRCVKPGDTYIYAFTKIKGTLYKTTILVHIAEKKAQNTDSKNYIQMSSKHEYYNNHISAEQAAQADSIAKSIANQIMKNANYKTDLQKVKAAAGMVAKYAAKGTYGSDANKYYRTPYGVFISGNFTCAGTTRALGRVLEFMGYNWQHINENEWKHQWCVLKIDGRIGYADAAVIPTGDAGYGEYKRE